MNVGGIREKPLYVADVRRPAESWRDRLEAEGAAIESVVNGLGGRRSLDVRDLDGRLAELITPGFWRT